MKLKKVRECYQSEVKKLLREENITFHDFNDYGHLWYDYINDRTYVTLGKYNGVYDYRIGIIDGNLIEI